MKRLSLVLAIIVAVGVFSTGNTTLAQSILVPHEDPATATAEGSLDGATLLLVYSNVFNLAAAGQYQDAQDLVQKIEEIDIPDELKLIIDRYNDICQQFLHNLDILESLLDEASASLSRNHLGETEGILDRAETIAGETQLLTQDIEATTIALSDKLGAFAASATNQLKQAYDRLANSLHRLKLLSDDLNKLRQNLAEKYMTQEIRLSPTELSLSANQATIFVGDSIIASGKLHSNGKPLFQKELTILLDEKPLLSVTTDSDGSYKTDITLPYQYVPDMTLNAEYVPSVPDIDTYLASQSPPAVINTMFYTTMLEVSAPETAHPGLPFTISGQISSTNGDIDRTIKVLLDETLLAEATVTGRFSLNTTPPIQIPTGKHTLIVAIAPQGRYAGISQSSNINVSNLPIQADIQTPKNVIWPQKIRITGKVYHETNPVQDALVNINFKGSSNTVRTSTDGSFTASLNAPLDLSLASLQETMVTIEPVQPWYKPLQVKRQILAINPLTISLMLALVISLGLFTYKRSRISPQEDSIIPQTQPGELPAITPTPEPRLGLTGVKGRIISAYGSGLEAIEKLTGTPMTRHVTLREFLKAASRLLPNTISPFAELTTLAEVALYSTGKPDEGIAIKAEELAATIKKELDSGTT